MFVRFQSQVKKHYWAKMNRVTCIVLASGFSRRFKSNKLIYNFKGKPLIEYTLEKRDLFDEMIVVTQYEKVKQLALKYHCKVIWNDHPEFGQSNSIKLGIQNCQTEYCLFMVADMPYLKNETIQRMIDKKEQADFVICEHNGILCNPMLVHKAYYPEFLALTGDRGAKQILKNHTYIPISLSDLEYMDIDERSSML